MFCSKQNQEGKEWVKKSKTHILYVWCVINMLCHYGMEDIAITVPRAYRHCTSMTALQATEKAIVMAL